MLEYYLLALVEGAAWEALQSGRLHPQHVFPGEWEIDKGFAWTSRLTASEAHHQVMLDLRDYRGPYEEWPAHQLSDSFSD